MANHPPRTQKPEAAASAGKTPPPVAPGKQLETFWVKNEKNIYIVCILIVLVAAAFLFWRAMQRDTESKLGAAYAAASTPDQIRAFIDANPGTMLAASAALRLADGSYATGDYTQALAYYDKAAANTAMPFASRARLGAAMSRIMANRGAEGVALLNQIVSDAAMPATIRAEAAYHLATIASADNRPDDAKKLYDQVGALAPGSQWADDAIFQRDHLGNSAAALPVSTPAGADATLGLPAVSFPGQ